MKRFFFFGEHVVPLRTYIKMYKKHLEKDAKLKIRINALTKANEDLNKQYNELLAKALRWEPKRGEKGRFVSKTK